MQATANEVYEHMTSSVRRVTNLKQMHMFIYCIKLWGLTDFNGELTFQIYAEDEN